MIGIAAGFLYKDVLIVSVLLYFPVNLAEKGITFTL